MEDAPTPIPLKKTIIKSSKGYKLIFNNKEFLANIILSDKIEINIKVIDNLDSKIYFKELSFEEFHQINKIFRQYETFEECYNCLLKFFDKNKVIINEEEEKLLVKFQINSLFGENEEVIIYLEKKSMKKYTNDNETLYKEIKELKKTIIFLEKEVKELKYKLSSLQNDNSEYKSIIESRLSKLEQKLPDYENIIDSKIISSTEELDFIFRHLKNYFEKNISLNLIYRASKDGDEPNDFHLKCDNRENVLVLYQTTKMIKFGGFSSIGFDSSNCGKQDLKSFIFNINNRKIYEAKENNQIGCFEDNGPFFGRFNAAIYMYDKTNFLTEEKKKHKTNQNIVSYKGLDGNDFEINNGEQFFNLIELEVFQIK